MAFYLKSCLTNNITLAILLSDLQILKQRNSETEHALVYSMYRTNTGYSIARPWRATEFYYGFWEASCVMYGSKMKFYVPDITHK